ncbi:uncharacterized [Tachysurus ichikawai]
MHVDIDIHKESMFLGRLQYDPLYLLPVDVQNEAEAPARLQTLKEANRQEKVSLVKSLTSADGFAEA